MYEEIVLNMLLTLVWFVWAIYTWCILGLMGKWTPLCQKWYLDRLFSEVHLRLVYIGLLSYWVVVALNRLHSFLSLLDSLVLLNSVGKFCLLLCQLCRKLLFKVDGPHAFICFLFLIWLYLLILYYVLWIMDLSF